MHTTMTDKSSVFIRLI